MALSLEDQVNAILGDIQADLDVEDTDFGQDEIETPDIAAKGKGSSGY